MNFYPSLTVLFVILILSVLASPQQSSLAQLKLGKSEGTNLLSNHYICASPVLPEFLSNLFTAMLRHGYVPNSLKDCIFLPIRKPAKDPSISDNYRLIALAPTLSKVFELCWSAYVTSLLQFGFERGSGLSKNVISKYCFNGSTTVGAS